ncbi:MAG: hypothetical protein IJ745_04335 [Bacteroidales bacterium]|nr:hypothetical protein [Bacteroidales bacterium]
MRCLYYGAWLRRGEGVTAVRVSEGKRQYDLAARLHGAASREANAAWWRLQMLVAAVWSSGNGSAEHPFHVTCEEDVEFMVGDVGLVAPLTGGAREGYYEDARGERMYFRLAGVTTEGEGAAGGGE